MKKRTRESLHLDLTPLIDVIFLLLIFFLVSTVFKKEELALLLNLPEGEAGTATSKDKKTIIELTKNELAINGNKIAQNDLKAEVMKITNKEILVELRVDKSVTYDRLILVLDTLKSQKLSNINLLTKE